MTTGPTAINEYSCIKLAKAVYDFSGFNDSDWECIDHVENYVNSYNETTSFSAGAYYNRTTEELVFSFRGSEQDLDDWVNNNFGGYGTYNIPPQFEQVGQALPDINK
jgi:hypothetical protein